MCCKNDRDDEEELNPHKFGIPTAWHLMTEEDKKERLAYLRFRMKIIAQANNFIKLLRDFNQKSHERKMRT